MNEQSIPIKKKKKDILKICHERTEHTNKQKQQKTFSKYVMNEQSIPINKNNKRHSENMS